MSSILIVDDEEDVRDFLAMVLEEQGYSVRTAPGGVEALLQIQKEKPQVILLDLMMPQINGDELCRVIKNDPDFFDIHIIILSARTDTESKVSCFEGGADEYLVKPIETRELIARMKSFFRLLRGLQAGAFSKSSPIPAIRAAQTVAVELESNLPRIRPKYGNFRVDALVGSGGMGHVFKGYDEHLERTVAIKVLSHTLSNAPRFVERFRREAKILASAEHPGIAAIYTFGEEDGDFFFSMQWCDGGSVQDLLFRRTRVELLTAVDILIQCIDALDAALALGIVHRDIKPSNLMFDKSQHIKIVDFGLATAEEKVSGQVTQASELFGTPDYMAPEQAQFGAVDHRADIYSLGITFYLLLYGKQPYTARSPIEMVVKHATEPFPAYDPMDGIVPREAYEIIEKMTQKSVHDRYQDYTSCRRDLVKLRDEIFSSTGVLLPSLVNPAPAPLWKTEDYFEILSTLYLSPHAGVLTIRTSDRKIDFLVENRHILFLDSPDEEETIWALLLEAGFIKKNEVPQPGSDFRECLMRFLLKQAFGFEDLKKVYRHHLKKVIMEVGRWSGVACEFHTGEVLYDDIEGIFLGDALLDLARSILSYEEIQEHYEPGCYLTRSPDFDRLLVSLSLTPEESFIASRIETDHGISVQELCLMTGFEEEKVSRFVYVLIRVGACLWKSAPGKKSPAARAEALQKETEQDAYARIADQFFQLARREFDTGNYWKVTELCKQAIRNDPAQSKHYHLMALSFAHHPRFLDDAEQCFLKAIEMEPQEVEYHLSLSRFFLNQGMIQRAGEEIAKALEIDPENQAAEVLQQEWTRKSSGD